jgi:hypothetical protein
LLEPQTAYGKLPKASDSRTLSLRSLLLPEILTGKVEPAVEVHHETVMGKRPWGELGNDTLRDCAIAAAGHAEMLWAVLDHPEAYPQDDTPLPGPTREQIVDAYSKITGYKQDDPTTDVGSDLLKVLKYWQSTGIADQKIGAFAEIPIHDIKSLKWTIASLGVAYVGLQLPSAWDVLDEERKNRGFITPRHWYDPATWQNWINGHCVIYSGYGEDDFTCVTWGKTMTVSLDFHRAYCDEAYAIISPERVDGTVATKGLVTKDLKAALERVTAPSARLPVFV